MDKADKVDRMLSYPLSSEVIIGVYGEKITLARELPVPMDIDHLLTNAPHLGMFLLVSFKENGEELLAPHKDDLWLHRPTSIASAPRSVHSAPVTHVAMDVWPTGFLAPASKTGLLGGHSFTLVVHVAGRPARAR